MYSKIAFDNSILRQSHVYRVNHDHNLYTTASRKGCRVEACSIAHSAGDTVVVNESCVQQVSEIEHDPAIISQGPVRLLNIWRMGWNG